MVSRPNRVLTPAEKDLPRKWFEKGTLKCLFGLPTQLRNFAPTKESMNQVLTSTVASQKVALSGLG